MIEKDTIKMSIYCMQLMGIFRISAQLMGLDKMRMPKKFKFQHTKFISKIVICIISVNLKANNRRKY